MDCASPEKPISVGQATRLSHTGGSAIRVGSVCGDWRVLGPVGFKIDPKGLRRLAREFSVDAAPVVRFLSSGLFGFAFFVGRDNLGRVISCVLRAESGGYEGPKLGCK